MKRSLLLLFSLYTGILVNAQSSPPWLWARGYGFAFGVYTTGLHSASNGNVCATGYFLEADISFGNDTLLNSFGANEDPDIFVAKLDSAGNTIWAQSIAADNAYSATTGQITADANGNEYISGYFSGPDLLIGQDTVATNYLNNNLFVAKFDSSGNLLWATCPSLSTNHQDDHIGGISADINGNLWVVGTFGDSITFGSTTLTSPGLLSVFVAQYSPAGDVLWAEAFGGAGSDAAYGITTDTSGNAYITGAYKSSAIIFGSYTLSNMGNQNIFTFKCSSSGSVLWAQSAGGTSSDASQGISIDKNDNIYITGYLTSASAAFGNIAIVDTAGYAQGFLARYDSSGNVIWSRSQAGNSGSAYGVTLSNDGNGNVYSAGYFKSPYMIIGADTLVNADASGQSSDIYLVKCDSSGNNIWALRQGGNMNDFPGCISNDAHGNTYVAGGYNSDSLVFGDTALIDPTQYSGTNYLAFIAKLADAPCTYSLPYDTLLTSFTGGMYSMVIGTQPGCSWSGEVTAGISWLGLSQYSGFGPDSIFIAVGFNNADTSRIGTLVINGMTITITQPGSPWPEGIATVGKTGIEVYPNPSSGQFYFKGIAPGSTLEVYDVLGQNIYSTTIGKSPSGDLGVGDTYRMNISSKAKGIYFYRVTDGNATCIQNGKIILQQ